MRKTIGYISYTHGLDGKVKIVPMVSKKEFEGRLANDKVFVGNATNDVLRITISAYNGKVFLCKIDGVNHIDEAKKLTKHEIFVDVQDMNVINPQELLGFVVFVNEDRSVKHGVVVDYGNYGAGDVIEVSTTANKKEYYLCNHDYIQHIDVQNKYIVLKQTYRNVS